MNMIELDQILSFLVMFVYINICFFLVWLDLNKIVVKYSAVYNVILASSSF